jgi:hypothetical protein
MNVTFTRTAERRYRVSVEGAGIAPSFMEPAPGYDARLPHDMAHFVVENELGIRGGVFGQLADGGHANTFRPMGERPRTRAVKRGDRLATVNREDGARSEKVVALACRIWTTGGAVPAAGVDGVSSEDLTRVCRRFDDVSAQWLRLRVGESMTLVWHGDAGSPARRRATPRGRGSLNR